MSRRFAQPAVTSHAPIVSIGMPVYNGARYVAAAIESILAQTLTDFTLVICDNASTDETEAICRDFAAKDARVHYHRNSENLGAHPNYNRTFDLSSGKYFKWAAHDDMLAPQYLERCVAAMESNPEAVICQSYLRYIDADGRRLGVYDSNLLNSEGPSVSARFASVILLRHPAYEIMGLFRRSALEGSLLLQSFHGADRALLAEMSLRGRMIQVREPLLLVRDHKDRYTQSHIRPKDRATWHDARLKGKLSLPTWRLYYEYCKMVARNRLSTLERLRCCGPLLRWWWRNWNAARMLVDLVSVVVPDAVIYAEKLKQRYISPQPGVGDLKRERDNTE